MTNSHCMMEMPILHTLARALNMTALSNSDTYPLKHKEGTKGESKREKSGCARSYNDHSIQPCAAVLYCVYVLVYSWARLLTIRDQLPTRIILEYTLA